MQIDKSNFLLPGNIYSGNAVIRVTSQEAAGLMVDPPILKRLYRALSFARPAVLDFGALRRMRRSETAWPAAAVAEVVGIVMQRYSGWPVRFCAYRAPTAATAGAQTGGQTSEATDQTTDQVTDQVTNQAGDTAQSRRAQGVAVFQSTNEQIGLAAATAAFAVVQSLVEGFGGPQLRKAIRDELRKFLDATLPSTPAADALLLARVATDRGIPWQVVANSRFVRVGIGPQSRIMKGTESTTTSSIGVSISRDKSMANRLLTEAGLPVPKQRTARSEKAALAAAQDLGYPLVVKPLDGNMGRDVTIGVASDDEMKAAFARAVTQSDKAVIETLIPGQEMRLMVAGGRLLSVAIRQPAHVVGDGTKTVAELVKDENRRPERESILTGSRALMKPLRLDEDALSVLAQQGLTVESVPEAGKKAYLRRESNVSRGGSPIDVTEQVHPSIIRAAEVAARTVRLDVCGVDFITTDLSKPWQETGGAICEINSRPGLSMQMWIAPDEKRDFILQSTFNALHGEATGSGLPVVALVGTAQATRRLRQTLEALAQRSGRKLGIVGGEAGKVAPSSTPLAATADLFKADDIDAALILVTPRDLLASGLGLPGVAAAVMPADLGERTAAVRRLLDRVAGDAVVTADDPAALERAAAALKLPTDGLASTWAPAKAAEPPAQDDREPNAGAYTVLFTGDVGFGESYLHRPRMGGLREVLSSQGHEHSIGNLVGLLQSADYVVGNLEVPLAGTPDPALEGRKNYLGWCDPDRTVAALRGAGFDALSLANNHALDCGAAGLAQTIQRLDEAGIRHFGAGGSEDDALRPLIHSFSAGGERRTLVVFGGFESRPRYRREYRWYASRNVAGVGMISPRWIGEWIRQNGGNLTNPTYVAFPHWGTDYEDIKATQRETASELVEQGVDLIIGHGAHMAQAVEIVGGKTVLFNAGNFIWNTPGRFGKRSVPPYGVAAALRFDETGSVPTLNLYPLMTDNEVTNFQSRPVTGPEVEASLEVLSQALPDRPVAAADGVGHHLRLAI